MFELKTLQNHLHAFEPIQDRPLPNTCWRVIDSCFSALTGTIHQIYTKFFEKREAAPLESAPIVPSDFDLFPPECQLHLLTFFDLPELAQFSRTAQYPNSLVSDPQIWKSIAARINCPINVDSTTPIYKQVLLFIERIQTEAAGPSWTHSSESVINILKRPTIDQIVHLQKWKQADQMLYYRYLLMKGIKAQLPGLNLEVSGNHDDLKSSHQIIAKAGEYSEWLLINHTLLRARDTLVLWQALAQAADLEGPGLPDLNTEDAVIEKSREFNDWFDQHQNALAHLERLDLSGKQLTSLPEQIWRLTQLRELNLRDNLFTSLSEQIGQLTQLQKLVLCFNQLTSLPEQIGQLTELRELDLDANKFNLFPMQICNLTRLRVLSFNSNKLTSLPEQIDKLTRMRVLSLNWNQISFLPEQIGRLIKLVRLDLEGNQITSLPEQFCNLTQLIYLDLRDNLLTSLPERFISFMLSRERVFQLSGNPFTLHSMTTNAFKRHKNTLYVTLRNSLALALYFAIEKHYPFASTLVITSVALNVLAHLSPRQLGEFPNILLW